MSPFAVRRRRDLGCCVLDWKGQKACQHATLLARIPPLSFCRSLCAPPHSTCLSSRAGLVFSSDKRELAAPGSNRASKATSIFSEAAEPGDVDRELQRWRQELLQERLEAYSDDLAR